MAGFVSPCTLREWVFFVKIVGVVIVNRIASFQLPTEPQVRELSCSILTLCASCLLLLQTSPVRVTEETCCKMLPKLFLWCCPF